MDDNKQFWERFSRHYAGFMRRSQATYQQICKAMRPFSETGHGCAGVGLRNRSTVRPSVSVCPELGGNRLFSRNDPSGKKAGLFVSAPFLRPGRHQLPYGPESFDAVVISNALHVMPHPEKALAEAWRVLKPGGWLFAPTFVWGKSRSARLRLWFMRLSGFRVYHVWTAGGADGIPVRARLFHRLSSASRKFVGAAVLSDGQEDPDERTAARQTTIRSAQLNHTKVKEE